MNTFYKLKDIWGIDAVKWVFEYILESLQDYYVPNADCRYWLKRNRLDYKKRYQKFEDFVNDNLNKLL